MPEFRSSRPGDRNLLFGILALQMDFIDRDALIAAMHSWVLDKGKSLGEILVQHGKLRPEFNDALEQMVAAHLKAHDDDPQESLAALSSVSRIRAELGALDDADVQASLAIAGASKAGDPDSTGPEITRSVVGAPAALRYRVLRPHARGGLGEVFVAEDEELHREVALKEIQECHAHDAVSRDRFLLEAEVTGGLEHPGIVPVYGMGRYADGRPFYAMRFVKGDNLKEAIRRFHEADVPVRGGTERSLAFRQLLRRFLDVCNAVAYAHSRGVLHRDLKPGNIMLGKYGETLVVDWGLAKAAGKADADLSQEATTLRPSSDSGAALTQAGTVVGTPAYMSPEQAAGRLDELGPRSDVYSLGATLYVLLAGKSPFAERADAPILDRVRRGDFPPPRAEKPSVPAALDAICRKAMSLRPDDRYASARRLADDIEHWLADEPVGAYREPALARVGRWARRHRPLVAAGVALLLTAVVALAVGLVAVDQERKRTEDARADEARERQRADEALANEAHAHQRADEARKNEARRRKQARAALDSLSSAVIDDWLSRLKTLLPEHKRFLQRALTSYEEFAREVGEDEETRAGVAAASLRVAGISHKLGLWSDSQAAYRRAIERYSHMAANFPAKPEYRNTLAACYNRLGAMQMETGHPNEALKLYGESMKVQKQLVADFPQEPDYRNHLAIMSMNVGNLLDASGKKKEAQEVWKEVLMIRKQLVRDFPKDPTYRFWLGSLHYNLSMSAQENQRLKLAEEHARESIALFQQLVTEYPNKAESRSRLTAALGALGDVLTVLHRPQEAEAALRQALTIQEPLVAAFPTQARFRFQLALIQRFLGVLLKDSPRYKESAAAFSEAHRLLKQLIADNPGKLDYRNELAMTLVNFGRLAIKDRKYAQACARLEEALPHCQACVRAYPKNPYYLDPYRDLQIASAEARLGLGEHANAAVAVQQLLRIEFEPAKNAYHAAGFLCRCQALAEKDTKLPEAKRKALMQTYSDNALTAIRKAVASGYTDAAKMKSDKDLEPLRSRADFQKLLSEVEAKQKAKGK